MRIARAGTTASTAEGRLAALSTAVQCKSTERTRRRTGASTGVYATSRHLLALCSEGCSGCYGDSRGLTNAERELLDVDGEASVRLLPLSGIDSLDR